MRRGDFAAAWSISDAVLRERAGTPCWHLPRHEQYVWDGTPLEGRRVLIRCYHGLGDTIQFIRYAPLVGRIAREVIVWAQPELVPLVRGVRGVSRVLRLHDGAPRARYDVDVEIMELPHVFRTTLGTVPGDVPYVHVRPARLPRDGRLAVGLVWRAGDWDDRRSLPPELMVPLARIPGVAVHVLQRGPALAGWPAGVGSIGGRARVAGLARVIGALDLVISVDSMPAHLAGAMGIPVWTLLHHEADWRWMRDRAHTPWYPSMRLFRQPGPGDWRSVLERVAYELSELTAPAARRQGPAQVA